MAKSVKALLNKKGWTGQEVGQLLMASVLHDIKGQGKGKPLFSQQQFRKIEASLTTDRERLSYGVYRDLYGSIINLFNRTQGLNQQFYNGYNYLIRKLLALTNRQSAEQLERFKPLVVTKAQYDRIKAQIEQETRGHTESVYSLMLSLIRTYVEDEAEPPKAVQEALEASKEELATNKRILSTYSKDTGYGYYELPDGRRSDQMERDDWIAAVREGQAFDNITDKGQFSLNGKIVTEDQILLSNIPRIVELQKYLYTNWEKAEAAYKEAGGECLGSHRGGGEEAIMHTLESTLESTHPIIENMQSILISSKTVWKHYDTPDDLTKYELLYYSLERYQGELEGDTLERCSKEFIEDYPALFEALKNYIEEEVAPQAKGQDLLEEFITWGELADLGLEEYKRLTTITDRDLSEAFSEDTLEELIKKDRADMGGIAILHSPRKDQVDDKGDYREPEQLYSFSPTLEELATDTEAVENIQQNKDILIYPALSYIYAYNTLLEILGEAYDLPDLAKVARIDTATYESRLWAYNSILYNYFLNLYGGKKDLERRRTLVKGIFTPLDAEETKPSKEAVKAVTEEIQGLGFTIEARRKLPYLDDFLLVLTGGNK